MTSSKKEPAWHSVAILLATAPIAAAMIPIWTARMLTDAILRGILR